MITASASGAVDLGLILIRVETMPVNLQLPCLTLSTKGGEEAGVLFGKALAGFPHLDAHDWQMAGNS